MKVDDIKDGQWYYIDDNYRPRIGRVMGKHVVDGFVTFRVWYGDNYGVSTTVLPSNILCEGKDPSIIRRIVTHIRNKFKTNV